MVPSMDAVGTTEASPTKIRIPKTMAARTIKRRVDIRSGHRMPARRESESVREALAIKAGITAVTREVSEAARAEVAMTPESPAESAVAGATTADAPTTALS